MIGISIAAKKEWEAVLNKLDKKIEDCNQFPFGEYFTTSLYGEDLVFYRCGVRKMNCSASTQYMIDHFNLSKVIVIGTCAGIDPSYKNLDIFFPNKLVQYDCTVKETEPLIKDSFTVCLNTENIQNINTGTLGTADKPVVTWKDYLELKENDILPSVRTMAKELKISALTVKKAYDNLEEEGFTVTVHGKGTYVAATNKNLMREEQLKEVEYDLEQAIMKGRRCGLNDEEIRNLFEMIMED